jgi:hypothetical protein
MEILLIIISTLCRICLFEFIRVEWGVKFVKHLKGAKL